MGTRIAIYKINERGFNLRKYTLLLPPFVTSFQALQLLMGLTQLSHSQTIAHDLDVALSIFMTTVYPSSHYCITLMIFLDNFYLLISHFLLNPSLL